MFCSKSPFTFHEFSSFLPSFFFLFYFALFLFLCHLNCQAADCMQLLLRAGPRLLVRRSEGRDFEDPLGLSNDQSLNKEKVFFHQDVVEGSQRRAQVEDKDISSSNSFFNLSLASFVQPISRSNANG